MHDESGDASLTKGKILWDEETKKKSAHNKLFPCSFITAYAYICTMLYRNSQIANE